MSIASRARSVTRAGVKVQRRIVIAQAVVWPTLILAAAALGTTAAVVVRRRRSAEPQYPDRVVA